MASSSSNNSDHYSIISRHIEEDKDREKKLKKLSKSFSVSNSEKSRAINELQSKSFLSQFEQRYLQFLRLQCMKDYRHLGECLTMASEIVEQVEEKQNFINNFVKTTLWTVRPRGAPPPPSVIYANNPQFFALKVNYNGYFESRSIYVNGEVDFIDWVEVDNFSIGEMNDIMEKLGCAKVSDLSYQYIIPGRKLDGGLRELSTSEQVERLLHLVKDHSKKIVEIFVLCYGY